MGREKAPSPRTRGASHDRITRCTSDQYRARYQLDPRKGTGATSLLSGDRKTTFPLRDIARSGGGLLAAAQTLQANSQGDKRAARGRKKIGESRWPHENPLQLQDSCRRLERRRLGKINHSSYWSQVTSWTSRSRRPRRLCMECRATWFALDASASQPCRWS